MVDASVIREVNEQAVGGVRFPSLVAFAASEGLLAARLRAGSLAAHQLRLGPVTILLIVQRRGDHPGIRERLRSLWRCRRSQIEQEKRST